jgi:hypothetical protein
MMFRRLLSICLTLAVFPLYAAVPYKTVIDSGTVLHGLASGGRTTDSGIVTLAIGDTLALLDAATATLIINDKIGLLISDSGIIALAGTEQSLQVNCIKGQVFLLRESIDTARTISILANGCTFAPIGTQAAIRLIKNETPSAAVLKGSIRATAANGATLDIAEGSYGTFEAGTGAFKQGLLPAPALEKLGALAKKIERAIVPEPVSAGPAPAAVSEPVAGAGAVETSVPEPVTAAPAAPLVAEQKTMTETPAATAPPETKAPAQEKPSKEKGEPPKEEKSAAPAEKQKIGKELSASYVTVEGEQWMRIAFLLDVPIWRFGLGLDLELFLDEKGMPSNKGWNFIDHPVDAVLRKLRYIRFNHEEDKVFAKVGGIDNVTFGYGFVVDRFTNMLRYPDEKQLGMQFYLNDVSPVGITLQTMVADFKEFGNDGGVLAGRLAFRPLKPTTIPLLNKLCFGGTFATDLNQYAPVRDWHYTGDLKDKNGNGLIDNDWARSNVNGLDPASLNALIDANRGGLFDTTDIYPTPDTVYGDSTNSYSVIGADIGLPLIQGKVVGLDLYGQFGMSYDDQDGNVAQGWGIGAPGVRLRAGPMLAQVEYRRISGQFTPSYFDQYYLNERIQRYPLQIKEDRLQDQILNGVFGSLTFDIAGLFTIRGTYQCLVSDDTIPLDVRPIDQRFEGSAGIGDALIQKIPKIKHIEGFICKKDIKRTDMNPRTAQLDKDAFFQITPNMYWGYRLGVEVLPNTAIIWESRYGKKFSDNGALVDDNHIMISAGLSF